MGPSSNNADGPRPGSRPLAAIFDRPTEAEWLTLVDKVLKGAPITKLDSATPGGVVVHPLYTQDSADGIDSTGDLGSPGEFPFLRGSVRVADRVLDDSPGWAVRVEIPCQAPSAVAEFALEALERGATEIALSDPGSGFFDSLDDLDAALSGVMVDLAPMHLRAGAGFTAAASVLEDLWDRRGVNPTLAEGGFGADPLGALASTGELPQGLSAALNELGQLAVRTASRFPKVRSITVDSSPYADAGADEVEELAVVLSTGVAYLRACSQAGLSADDACRQIELRITTDADIFTGAAKLRVLRKLWAAVAVDCGASDEAAAPRVSVRTSAAMMTRRDPWVNLLRVTAASLAAALGGADSLTTLPYDQRLGDQGELGRRMSRNTQLLLQEESNLTRVIDPMGGSWYLESLTNGLAEAAWKRFVELESSGGASAELIDGPIREQIAAGVTDRLGLIATRRVPITGVSEFPNIDEPAPPLGEAAERDAYPGAPGQNGGGDDSSGPTDPSTDSSTSTSTSIDPLGVVHWARDFETLRDRSDSHLSSVGQRPRVFLVNLGPVAKHTARATYAQNFYGAGGIESATSDKGAHDGFNSSVEATADAQASNSDVFCICSSDDIYTESAVEVAAALSAAGLGPIHLAGRPGDLEQPLRDAGVEQFIYVGVDVVEVLTKVHDHIGTPEVNH